MKKWLYGFLYSLTAILFTSNLHAADTSVIGNSGWERQHDGVRQLYPSDRMSIGGASLDHQLSILLKANDNIFIDGSTNPREITQGVFIIEHTPAITGTRPITLNIDTNNQGDTRGLTINYETRGIQAGDENHIYDVNIDTSNSTGGDMMAFHVDKTGSGSISVVAMEVREDIDVIKQIASTGSNISQAWKYTGSYTDVTAAFSNTGTNTQIFTNDNDYIYVGQATIYKAIKVLLATESSHSIMPTFEYSIGSSNWTGFSPSDGTNGFQLNGTISWTTLSGWAVDTVNGAGSKYWIRIKRQRNQLSTPPTESKITTTDGTIYQWDKNGDINAHAMSINSNQGLVFTNQTTSGAGNTGTLLNSPVSGNPTAWLRMTINGQTRYIPAW